MSIPILSTKLYIPSTGFKTNLVPRPCLIELFNQGLQRKFTLISAPAGFGKTTLVRAWLHPSKVTWFSLDETDNDPARFLTYFIAALQQIGPDIGKTAQEMLRSSPTVSVEPILRLAHPQLQRMSSTKAKSHRCYPLGICFIA